MTDILLIDDNVQRRELVAQTMGSQGWQVTESSMLGSHSTASCIAVLDRLIDNQLTELVQQHITIILSETPTVPAAVAAIKQGASDYLCLPMETQDLIAAIERAVQQPSPASSHSRTDVTMVGSSDIMQVLKEEIAKIAPTDSTVLILGQSGTGKELVARAVHAGSARSVAPMISINCATVPPSLIEAELFGTEQSPNTRSQGLVHAADRGTLFLDEISELPSAAQARLLNLMQGEFRRVGGSHTETANVRIIAATHQDLNKLVNNGQFREDLYYRLNVVSLRIPTLKERRGDIVEIAEWLLQRSAQRLGKEHLSFAQSARQALLDYHWPGNVRELENAVERAVILSDDGASIDQAALAIEVAASTQPALDPTPGELTSLEDYFVKFVQEHQDNLTETELAEKLGISRKSLWERRQRLNIPRRKTRKRGTRRDSASS